MLSREASAKPPSGNFLSRLYDRIENFVLYQSTFFRLHLFAFVFIPLISSAIFWGCNGRFKISYLDSLFLCYSAMTVTGLSTVNLSSMTAWQQIILYLLMMMGDITMVSWIMVLVRKCYFKRTCEYEYVAKKRRPPQDRKTFLASISPPMNLKRAREPVPMNSSNNRPRSPKSTEGPTPTFKLIHPTPAATFDIVEKAGVGDRVHEQTNLDDPSLFTDNNALTSSPEAINTELPPEPVTSLSPRAHGVDFAYTTSLRRVNTFRTTNGVPLTRRTTTILTNRLQDANASDSKHKYDMGFPGPVHIARKALKTFSPKTYRKLERKLTMPYTRTVEGSNVSWLSPNSEIVVGPNSDFHVETLSDDLVEQIGGIEYVALRWLSYMVPLYFIGTQLISFILFAPWLSATHQYDDVFANQLRIVQKPWFSLFQVMGAYTGGGLSLVDEGMVPFQSAYLMVFSLMFVILAGNHALVGFLITYNWIGSKIAKPGSESEKAFSFLLDHPRRCVMFVTLYPRFPSHQTWFLVICLFLFSTHSECNWYSLSYIGLEVWTSLSIGPRIVSGLFQGLAARASGFSIVSVSSLAPAVQFLYVVMMYIAVYPVALSIRSTNVYEERSLGVFEAQPEEVEEEPTDFGNLGPRQRVGRYIGWHLRRQLSIDIWWLVWGVFLIAIIERDNLLNDDLKWFDLFRVLFELVSAFGGIGLSLGIPTENYSFVGAMRPLSKLVVIVIMVRGRHRGLPVAVDRAVMLPEELMKKNKDVDTNADVPRAPMSPLSTSNGNGHLNPLAEEV
ncbi:potassium transporter [Lentinula aff. lateritia]|uniref:Potassium transporter n=1 Tax=Lentinula aff. lateritia TaxID=2804960 RepID=A0ACC1U4E1_9AGAR|nr:potassium transporter [Lentinula aff. lateritia]